jgi:hypothetical protein
VAHEPATDCDRLFVTPIVDQRIHQAEFPGKVKSWRRDSLGKHEFDLRRQGRPGHEKADVGKIAHFIGRKVRAVIDGVFEDRASNTANEDRDRVLIAPAKQDARREFVVVATLGVLMS